MKTILTAVLAILLMAALAFSLGGSSTELVTYTWTAPTEGSDVDRYVVQISVNGGEWADFVSVPTETVTIPETYGQTYVVRVAGIDAQGRQGIYSDTSDPYTPDKGAPSKPGTPIRVGS
jgi:hypothetical protein